MDLSETQGVYNLLEEKWIPVLYGNGKTDRVGIWQAFIEAHKIRQIAASNPMDRVALLRFLMAVLLWCKEDAKSSLAALDEKSTGIPENWLAKLQEHKTAFNLLGDDPRFYQDASLKGKVSRPIGDLLVEFPGADSVNHMRHVVHDHDSSYGFCPACCAVGILRLSVWAPANGPCPASVNPGSAVYAFIEGKNLFQTLRANLPETNPQVDQAPWLGNEQPDSPDAVARLAWRPRKLWLNVGSENDACANCGSFGEVITSLCNEGGWPTPITSNQEFARAVETELKNLGYSAKGKDQANKNAQKGVKMAPIILKCRMDDLRKACGQSNPQPQTVVPTTQTDAQELARLFHRLILMNDECAQAVIKALTKKPNEEEKKRLGDGDMWAKKFWDADPHLLRDGEAISLPGLGEDVAMHSSRFWRDALRLCGQRQGKVFAIGPVVNKFTFQDATSVFVPNEAANQRVERSASIRKGLLGLVKYTTPNRDRVHPEILAATVLATPDAETRVQAALISESDDEVLLCEIYEPVVEQIVASTAKGSPLRRRAAKEHAKALLRKKIKELVEQSNRPSNEGTPAAVPGKPESGCKKGGPE